MLTSTKLDVDDSRILGLGIIAKTYFGFPGYVEVESNVPDSEGEDDIRTVDFTREDLVRMIEMIDNQNP